MNDAELDELIARISIEIKNRQKERMKLKINDFQAQLDILIGEIEEAGLDIVPSREGIGWLEVIDPNDYD